MVDTSLTSLDESICAFRQQLDLLQSSPIMTYSSSRRMPVSVFLPRFSGDNPAVWVLQAEKYFSFHNILSEHKLSLASFYFDGEALEWYRWLFRNKQLAGWDHFVDKLMICFRSRIRDTNREFLPISKQHEAEAQVCQLAEQEFVSSLNEDNLNTIENFEFSMMFEHHVANSKLHPELLNSRGDSSTSIPFPSSVISFSCIETLSPMLDSKNDLKDDPSSYVCKVFAEMPDKKIDMEAEHLVIKDSENPASQMFDEMFQTVSVVKGEYSDLIMLDNNHLALPCLLSAYSHAQLMRRSIFDYFKEFDHAKIPLSSYRFHPAQFRFNFPFDPGSSLPIIFLGTASYYSGMVVDDFKWILRIFTCHIDSVSNAQCILPQFPFDPGANLFIMAAGGCLQDSTLQPEASNWDPATCSKSTTRIELTTRVSVYPWRKTTLVLLFALSDEHKVRPLTMNVSEICVPKIITATLGSYLIDYYFLGMSISRYYDDDLWAPSDSELSTFSCFGLHSPENDFALALAPERYVLDTLQPQLLISLRFGPMRGVNAISSCYSVSTVVVSEAELDNCGLLCFSLLLVTIVKREFQQQLDFIVLTACSPEMAESIKFEVLNDYSTSYFTKPATDIFDAALVVSLYHDALEVAGQIRREGSAQILHWMNIVDCILSLSGYILSLPKLMVSINYTRNVDTPLGSQNEAGNLRNHVAWVFDISLRRDITLFPVPLANKAYTVTKGYIAPKGHTKLLVSVISHIYNVEIVLFESLYLLKSVEWSLPVISKIWSTVMLIGKVVRKLPTPASNLLLLVSIASFIAPMRIITMISILYYSNLEDKVLIGVVGIVMNGPSPILANLPNIGLSGYEWDPG